jgi:hypothetical protein
LPSKFPQLVPPRLADDLANKYYVMTNKKLKDVLRRNTQLVREPALPNLASPTTGSPKNFTHQVGGIKSELVARCVDGEKYGALPGCPDCEDVLAGVDPSRKPPVLKQGGQGYFCLGWFDDKGSMSQVRCQTKDFLSHEVRSHCSPSFLSEALDPQKASPEGRCGPARRRLSGNWMYGRTCGLCPSHLTGAPLTLALISLSPSRTRWSACRGSPLLAPACSLPRSLTHPQHAQQRRHPQQVQRRRRRSGSMHTSRARRQPTRRGRR